MKRRQKRKRQKIESLLCMIAAGMIHLTIIFAAAIFVAVVRQCKWFSEMYHASRKPGCLRSGIGYLGHWSLQFHQEADHRGRDFFHGPWSPMGKAGGSQETPHKGRTSRTRGPIHPRVEPVVLLVRDG